MAQYPLIQFKERSNRPSVRGKASGKKGKGKGKGKFGNRRFDNHKRHVKHANMAYDTAEDTAYTADYNEDVEPYDDPAYDDDYEYDYDYVEEHAYAADEQEPRDHTQEYEQAMLETSVEADAEATELECISLLSEMLGDNFMDEAQTCTDFCQSAHTAMLSTKGPYKGKGKGKGHKGRYPVRPSNLSIEDRRRKLQELKSKTECKDCDRQCTMTKTAHMASNASSSAAAGYRNNMLAEYRQL